jgi:hypothetical protein
MLANSFSFLPVAIGAASATEWKLLSDYSVASDLRGTDSGNERNRRLARKLSEAIEQDAIQFIIAPV